MNKNLHLLLVFFLFTKTINAQNASSYCFTTGSQSYSTLSGATNFSGINANSDDVVSDVTPLPFDFIFGGQVYSQITISSNGWLSFVAPNVSPQQNYDNTSINASAIKPLLMPLWDDLKNNLRTKYVVSGSAPNRIFKVEWSQQKWDYQSNNDVISFQIWLYETSNVIEYTYNRGVENVTNGSATIGLYDAADTFLILNNSGTSPTASTTSFTTDISAKPASNQVYRFSPPVPSLSVGTYTFCVDNTQTTANVSSGRYATVNVVKGFTYTVSVGDVFASSHENLTLLDATSANVLPPITATGNTGTSITWTATSSGTMRVLLTSTCGSTGSGPMSLSVNSVGNTQDSQTTFGTNQWVGHVYNHVDGPPPGGSASPTSPSTTTSPFLSANYVGYYNIASETINEGFGGNTTCFPVLSNGVVRTSIYTELFSVRYRMKSTRAAGCYFLNVNGDDGVRVYVDGVLVFNQWKQQGNTAYCNNLIYLNGNSDIILDYYEHQGGNVVGFSLTPFDGSANIITSSSDIKVCSTVSPGLIDGASFGSCTGGTNGGTNTIYQWQISNDNVTFTDISGINTEDYTPAGITNGTTSNIIKYYRRALKAFASNASSCVFYSNSVKVTTSPGIPATPTAIAGTGATCTQITANWQTQTNATSYLLDVSTVSNFASFVSGFQNLNVGNVVTYNVLGLTSNITYYYRVRAVNGCGTSPYSNTITYATSSSPTFIVSPGVSSCPNTNITYTTQSGMSNYTWTITGTLGVDYSITSGNTGTSSNTVTLNWLTSGSKTVTVNYTSGCSGTTAASNTTVIISAPTIGTVTNANCVTPTGSVVLSGLPSTGTWTLTRSGTSSAITSGTGTSTTISGLAAGSYTYTVSIGGCTSVGTAIGNIVLNPVVTTTYTGSTWSSTPDLTMIGVINSNTPIASDVNLCNCTVNTGINAVVNPGITLKLQDKLTVNGTGTLAFENTSSLVQINNVLNTGNISYKRLTTTAVRKTDYTYWSTPVSPLKLAGVGGISYNPSSLEGSIFYSYLVSATSEDWTSESAASTMGIGKGYIIRGPESILSPFSFLEATFVGVPNNGNVSIAVGKSDASYLLGNPYPSAIDADSFLIANTSVLDGTLYFWTHNTQIGVGVSNPGTGVFAYSQDDYAAYNLTGGVGIVKGGVKADSDPNSPGVIPLGKIGAGQGFFATSQATGSIEFNNSMRVSGTSGNNAQFFKQSTVKGKTTNGIEKNRIWLDLANEQGAFKQILVGYVTGATNDIDSAYDGETWDSHEFLDFYSINQNKNLVIQGRSLPFDEDDEVPLGYRTTIDGDFSISIGQTDGLLTGQSVYIEDKLTNTITNLNNDIYTFNTSVGTFNDRFVLRYINKNLNIADVDPKEYGIYFSNKNKEIKINSTTERINSVDIYDISGKLIFQKTKIDSNQLVISNLLSAHQVLLVSVSLLDGVVVTKKLIH